MSEKELKELFLNICWDKRLDSTMPLKLIIHCDRKILMVGYRMRRDLNVVVNQMKKCEATKRSSYANYLWEKSILKTR